MGAPINKINSWVETTADMIIDVRSPSEFENDHIPGAINMPVLNDDERAEVGTMYKNIGAFHARRYGGAIVAKNISQHILNYLQEKPAEFRPMVYCWRGGQRSNSFARICSDIGWQTYILEGGYKSYRKEVLIGLETIVPNINPILISGPTGTGKTRLLHQIAKSGGQILDLEGLANHRGSLLGLKPGEKQPSQRYFESLLLLQIRQLKLEDPIFVEAESSKIGEIQIPKYLFKLMKTAPIIEITMPLESRAKFLMKEYQYLQTHSQALYNLFDAMFYRHGEEKTNTWRELAKNQDWYELALNLIQSHYDPAYKTSSMRKQREVNHTIMIDNGSNDEFKKAAKIVLEKYKSEFTGYK